MKSKRGLEGGVMYGDEKYTQDFGGEFEKRAHLEELSIDAIILKLI
jgi:hypothetical protein